jgi:2-keto-4-pentenoate hydratase
MEQAKVAEAARLLVEARRTGRRIAELPRDCKPATAADANQIIDAISEALDEAVAGWKITFLYKPREKPFRCPLFASRVFASPAQIPQSLTPSLCIEPEVTFRAIRDLPPRAAVYRAEEVAAAVEACPSFEVVDTRFDTSNRTIRQMLNERASLIEAYADHITSGAFIVGPALKDWRDLDFARMRVTMRKDDTPIVETDGGHAFIDPFLPVVVMVNELRHGAGLKAGQIIATGSFSGFFPVDLGQRITAEFAGLGRVEAMFVK